MTLGRVLSSNRDQVTILTSTGYLIDINWDGSFDVGQIWYTGASCSGTAYLNSGGATPKVISGKWVVYSGSFSTLMRPLNVTAGVSTSVGNITVQSIDNPTCGSATTGHGWELVAITNTAAGLPATIAGPITIP